MSYQPKEGDLLIGIYDGKEMRLFYSGMSKGIFLTPEYYIAEGENIGELIEPRHARDVIPKSLVQSLGGEKWQQVLSMPSLQRLAKLEELIGSSPQQPRKKRFGFI